MRAETLIRRLFSLDADKVRLRYFNVTFVDSIFVSFGQLYFRPTFNNFRLFEKTVTLCQILNSPVMVHQHHFLKLLSASVYPIKSSTRLLAKGIDYLHVNTTDNNPDTPFEFTSENLARIDSIRACYPDGFKHCPIIAVLDLAQRQNGGWLSLSAMNKTAQIMGVDRMRVYEVASFYSMFKRTPSGAKYRVNVCTTTPCWLRNANGILDEFKKAASEMRNPKDFEIGEVECLGACCNAPMVQINDDYHEDLSVGEVRELLEGIVSGSATVGPMKNKRHGSEPIDRKTNQQLSTTLKSDPPGPGFGVRPDL